MRMITWHVLVWDGFWYGAGFALGAAAALLPPLILLGAWAYVSEEFRAWCREGWLVFDLSWKRRDK